MLRQLVSDSEFVREIPEELTRRLEQIAHVSIYSPGTTLFSEGFAHPHFHLIASGHVRLEMHVPGRGRVAILTAGKGDVLAWSAVLGNGAMTATAIALDAVKTVSFRGEQLRQLCEEEHEIGYHVMKQLAAALSRRLLATRLQMLDLFGGAVPRAVSATAGGAATE